MEFRTQKQERGDRGEKQGLVSLGSDGKLVNLHHMTQTNDSSNELIEKAEDVLKEIQDIQVGDKVYSRNIVTYDNY